VPVPVDDRPANCEEMFTAMAGAFGTPPPWKLPRWVFRLVAPYVATFAVDTSMPVSPAKAHAELGWRPAFPTYLDGIARHDHCRSTGICCGALISAFAGNFTSVAH
jgi:nucleoside-diphosphate-sugar epimerase